MSSQRSPTIFDSFNYASEGIIHVLRTQRNMRIHFVAAAVVLVLALWVGVTKIELIALLISITFVLMAEMINTAIEGAIDVSTTSFDPMAKLAKDVAAGAVLIATLNALAVGYLVFSGADRRPLVARARRGARRAGRADDRRARRHGDRRDRDEGLTRAAAPRCAAACRPATRRSRSPAGSRPRTSRAAQHRFLVSTIALVLALLVAQTRIESGVHSAFEVLLGGLLGALIALSIFQLA